MLTSMTKQQQKIDFNDCIMRDKMDFGWVIREKMDLSEIMSWDSKWLLTDDCSIKQKIVFSDW